MASYLPCEKGGVKMDVAGVVLNLAPVYTVAGVVFVALAGIWGVRKVIRLLNRS